MKTYRPSFDTRKWLRVIIAAVILAVFGWLYSAHLSSFLPLSGYELTSGQHASGIHSLLSDPLNFGFKVAAFVGGHLIAGSIGARLPAVLCAALSIALFFLVCRAWYGTLTAAATTVLFGTSSWLLTTGRFGAAYVYATATVMSLLAAACWLKGQPERWQPLAMYTAVSLLALLTPGGIWASAAFGFVLHKELRSGLGSHFRKIWPSTSIVSALVAGLLIAGFAHHPPLVSAWLGLPASFPGVGQAAKQSIMSLSFLVARGPVAPQIWLAHTPVLDAASTTFLLLGAILYGRHLTKKRTQLALACLIPAVILITLNGADALSFILPGIYITIAGGIAYLSHRWTTVFPKNPLAHGLAASVVIVLLGCIANFHINRYWVAWRYSPETVRAYEPAKTAQQLPNLLQ